VPRAAQDPSGIGFVQSDPATAVRNATFSAAGYAYNDDGESPEVRWGRRRWLVHACWPATHVCSAAQRAVMDCGCGGWVPLRLRVDSGAGNGPASWQCAQLPACSLRAGSRHSQRQSRPSLLHCLSAAAPGCLLPVPLHAPLHNPPPNTCHTRSRSPCCR
jgi:hypothetical protein